MTIEVSADATVGEIAAETAMIAIGIQCLFKWNVITDSPCDGRTNISQISVGFMVLPPC